jgi:hypothetical protein
MYCKYQPPSALMGWLVLLLFGVPFLSVHYELERARLAHFDTDLLIVSFLNPSFIISLFPYISVSKKSKLTIICILILFGKSIQTSRELQTLISNEVYRVLVFLSSKMEGRQDLNNNRDNGMK